MRHIRAAGDAHPAQANGFQRRTQAMEPVAEQAAIDRPPFAAPGDG